MTAPTQIRTAEMVRDDFLDEVAANTSISDTNLGGVIRTIGYGFGEEMDELYFQLYRLQRAFYIKTATGTALDDRGADYGLTRRAATYAIGTARFTCSGSATITPRALASAPATTARSKILFATPSTGTYSRVGAGTIDVPIRALFAGSEANLAAATITQLDTTISNVTAVTNPADTTLGDEREDDDAFRDRILRHIEGLSRATLPSIYNGAIDFERITLTLATAIDASATEIEVNEDLTLIPLSISGTGKLGLNGNTEVVTYTGINTATTPHKVTGVTRAAESTSAVAHEVGIGITEYVPTGRGVRITSASVVESACHVDVYVDDGTTTGTHSELVSLVQKRLRGDGTTRDPGYKAGGVTLTATAVTPVTITVVATLQYEAGYDSSAVILAVKTALASYFNALKVGDDVDGYQVSCLILSVEGVRTITTLTINTTAFDGATAANVTISTSQVARSGTHTIT